MATTTNYSWSTPDDTALVKDGAAAIRSLGTAIDSTVFTNAGAAINKTIVDAKGDLIVASGADAVARLAVGTNDHVLTADSGATNGVKWAAIPPAGGITLLSTTTLSGVSTTVSSISGSYKALFIEVYGATWATENDSLAFEINNAAFTSTRKLSTASVSTNTLETKVTLNDGAQPAQYTNANNYFSFYFNNYSSTTDYKTFTVLGSYEGTSGGRTAQFFGGVASDSAITSFTFATVLGLAFSAGTIKVYGVS
jgi:hypothetical protein